jgi:hypothetical protein
MPLRPDNVPLRPDNAPPMPAMPLSPADNELAAPDTIELTPDTRFDKPVVAESIVLDRLSRLGNDML